MKKKLTFEERIKEIKKNNPGKFDHLPDPTPGSPLRDFTEEEITEFENKLKQLFNKNKL